MSQATNPFKKATKQAARLRLALIGPPGSGKTYSALAVATALAPRVAVIDTEFRSASKYADLFPFDVLELEGSFHPRRYIEAIRAAEAAAYDVCIVDSLSQAWIGKDGGLDLHDAEVARQKSKNAFTAWAAVTPHHQALVQTLVQCRCHLIVTMRSKVEYVQEKDASGKPAVRKVGTAPLMREGLEYEFDVCGDMDADNTLVITKSRCPALSRQVIPQPGAALAAQLMAWLGAGGPGEANAAPAGNGNGNGHGRQVITGLALVGRIRGKDDALAAEGLCNPGDLLAAVRQAGEVKGLGREVERWGEQGFEVAIEATRIFEMRRRAERKQAAAPPRREPGDEEPDTP